MSQPPRGLALGLLLVSLAVVTGGCSQSSSPPPNASGASRVTDALYECITSRGWDVALTPDGGIEASSTGIPAGQYDRYLGDLRLCNDEVSAEFPVDDRQKNLLYAAELTERSCLLQHGYSVAEPPSRQQFVDGYDTHPWSALASSSLVTASQTMSDSAWDEINTVCPQPVPGSLE